MNMKKRFLFFLLLFETLDVIGQNNGCLSAGFVTDCYHYIIGRNMTNGFNYGFSMLVSQKIRKVKASIGVGYSTKSLQTQTDFGNLSYELRYFHFPVLANVDVFSCSTDISGGVLAGFIFNHIVDYKIIRQSPANITSTESGLLNNRKTGISLILGASFSKTLGDRCVVEFTPFVKYNLVDDHGIQRPDYRNIPDDKVSIGCRLGVELLLIRSTR